MYPFYSTKRIYFLMYMFYPIYNVKYMQRSIEILANSGQANSVRKATLITLKKLLGFNEIKSITFHHHFCVKTGVEYLKTFCVIL